MNRRLPFHSNAVWPPALLVSVFAVFYGIIAAGLWLIRRTTPGIEDTPEIIMIRDVILSAAAGLYALFRLWRFHPACNYAYRNWLKLSPWTAAKPLPLGPVHPVWQDAAVIGLLTAIAHWHAHADPAWPGLTFGFVYLVGMTVLIAVTRRWWHALALGFLWPTLMLPAGAGASVFVVIGMIILVTWFGHRQSMKAFPWEFLKYRPAGSWGQTEIRVDAVNTPASAGTRFNLGWPFMALSPKVQPPKVSVRANLAWSTLFGWWIFCVIENSKMDPLPELILMFAIFAAAIRLGIYCNGVTPPFNVWGRFVSGRIIVPGFDKVFLTPIAVVLAAILGVIIVKRSGAWYPAAEAVVFAAVWFLLLGGGPSLRNWILTGQFRLKPPNRLNANRQVLRSS